MVVLGRYHDGGQIDAPEQVAEIGQRAAAGAPGDFVCTCAVDVGAMPISLTPSRAAYFWAEVAEIAGTDYGGAQRRGHGQSGRGWDRYGSDAGEQSGGQARSITEGAPAQFTGEFSMSEAGYVAGRGPAGSQ